MLPYLKLFTEARNDAKLRSLTDRQFRCWFRLLCFAAEQPDPNRGSIRGLSHHHVAIEVCDGDQDLLVETCNALQALHGVTWRYTDDSCVEIMFVNFEKRQQRKPSDAPERARERAAKYRERKRSENISKRHAPVTPPSRPVTRDVTPRHASSAHAPSQNEQKTGHFPGIEGVTARDANTLTSTGSECEVPASRPVTRNHALDVDVEGDLKDPIPPTHPPQSANGACVRSGEDLAQLNEAEKLLASDLRTADLAIDLGRQHNTARLVSIAGWKWLRAAQYVLGPGVADSKRRSIAYLASVAANLQDADREEKPPAKRETKAEKRDREMKESIERMKEQSRKEREANHAR